MYDENARRTGGFNFIIIRVTLRSRGVEKVSPRFNLFHRAAGKSREKFLISVIEGRDYEEFSEVYGVIEFNKNVRWKIDLIQMKA